MPTKEAAPAWSLKTNARNIHVVEITLDHVGDEQYVLLQSDVHWDNPKCDRAMLTRHLDLALERHAPVIDVGDFFCAMQGKWDKRANKNDLRPEHQRANYLDALVETAADYLKPYRSILTIRGQGNHETGIIKRHETNLTERLVERLRMMGSGCVVGGYSGYVVFYVRYSKTRYQSIHYYYHHGYGGGGPVTRGVIQTNRQAVYLADADIVHSGHTHDSWQVPIARVKLSRGLNSVEHTRQVHVRTAGYKNEYDDGYGGWHIERGGPPKPIGAAWLRISFDASRGSSVDFEITEAR